MRFLRRCLAHPPPGENDGMTIAKHAREKLFRGELLLHAGDEFSLFFWGEEMMWFAHGTGYGLAGSIKDGLFMPHVIPCIRS